MNTTWKPLSVGGRRRILNRLEELNLLIMQATVSGDRMLSRQLKSERERIRAGLERADQRAVALVA